MKHELQGYLSSASQTPSSSTLTTVIRELFPEEILEQRRLVYELMQSQNCTPPETTEASTNTHSRPITGESAASIEVSHIDGLLQELATRHRRVLRAILIVLFAAVAVASFSISLALSGLHHRPTGSASREIASMSVSETSSHGALLDRGGKPKQEIVAVPMGDTVTGVADSTLARSDGETTLRLGSSSGAVQNPITQAPRATGDSLPATPRYVRRPVKSKTLPPVRDYGI